MFYGAFNNSKEIKFSYGVLNKFWANEKNGNFHQLSGNFKTPNLSFYLSIKPQLKDIIFTKLKYRFGAILCRPNLKKFLGRQMEIKIGNLEMSILLIFLLLSTFRNSLNFEFNNNIPCDKQYVCFT